MEHYNLGEHIIAFTTDRTQGREGSKVLSALSFDGSTPFFYPHQTHTSNVMLFDNQQLKALQTLSASGDNTSKDIAALLGEGMDAVITNVPNVCLGVSTADCIPVIVYDPAHHCAAAIHAGWRGTVARIVEKAMKKMSETYGTVASDCTAVIGPGISQRSFEIGWEVHQQFVDAGFPMDDVTIVMPSNDGNGNKPHIDLKEINRLQLLNSGLSASNITVSDIDTFTDERFFSARREQKGTVKCGRILSGFILNPV